MAHVAGRRFADVPTGSSSTDGRGGAGGLRIEETTDMGERYVVDVTTGEKFIRGSRRADGTYRRDIRVRADYVPLEERRTFQTRQQLSRAQRNQMPGGVIGGGGLVASPFPPGYSGTPAAATVSRKSAGRSAAAAVALSPGSSTPHGAAATTGGGSEGGRRPRSHGKKSGAAAGASAAAQQQQQQHKNEQQQKAGADGAANVGTEQLADAMEAKLRLVEGGSPAAGNIGGRDDALQGDETATETGRDSKPAADAPKTPEELRKRIRNVKKKLNEVEALRAKYEAGTSVSDEQLRKLQRAEPLKKELEILQGQLRKNEDSGGSVCCS